MPKMSLAAARFVFFLQVFQTEAILGGLGFVKKTFFSLSLQSQF